MQPLATALRRLELLAQMVDRHNSMRGQSTEESRELYRQIAQTYGAVEEVYRQYAGDRAVILPDGKKTTFATYFEAGYLSGRTFHVSEGRRELEKVIGRVRADLEDEVPAEIGGDRIDQAWTLLHPRVQVVAKDRFASGHYADAVEATFKELASTVRALVLQRGGPELDGVPLMQKAFSANDPIIALTDLSTESGRGMQRGYMELFAGGMAAIRNPKAHGNVVITPERALHLLFIGSTLWFTLDERP